MTATASDAVPVPVHQQVDAAAIRDRLRPQLDDLAARIDVQAEERIFAAWSAYALGTSPEPVFRGPRRRPAPPRAEWPEVHINDAQCDPALMVLSQLRQVSEALARGDGGILCVRCNYGTPILATACGVAAQLSDCGMGTLPGSRPLGTAAVRALAAGDAPSADTDLLPLVLAVGRAFRHCLDLHPALAHVHLYHPDLQGPLDVLELVWGSDCFVHFADEPGLADAALSAITGRYLDAWRAWCGVQPPRADGLCVHWGMLFRGHVVLRDDSAMNLSPAMVRRLVEPHDRRILAAAGGGAIHACGKVDHWLPAVAGIPGLHAINLGQPHMNDPQRVWASTVARGIALTPLPPAELERARQAGLEPRGLVALAA
jgi:hypothetical protein